MWVFTVACFVIRARCIVSVVSSIISFSIHRPRLESYRVSQEKGRGWRVRKLEWLG